MVEGEIESLLVRVVVEVIDSVGVDQRRPALNAMNRITFGQQQLGKIGAVLTGDACDQRGFFGHEQQSLDAMARRYELNKFVGLACMAKDSKYQFWPLRAD